MIVKDLLAFYILLKDTIKKFDVYTDLIMLYIPL